MMAFLVELALLTSVLKQRWGDIDQENILGTIYRTLGATVLMAVPVALLDYTLSQTIFSEPGRITALLRVGVDAVVGTGIFLGAALLFNIQEVKQIPTLFRRRRRDEPVATAV